MCVCARVGVATERGALRNRQTESHAASLRQTECGQRRQRSLMCTQKKATSKPGLGGLVAITSLVFCRPSDAWLSVRLKPKAGLNIFFYWLKFQRRYTHFIKTVINTLLNVFLGGVVILFSASQLNLTRTLKIENDILSTSHISYRLVT